MKCHGCSSLMVLDKQETGTGSCTQWHSCPLCGKVRLTSHPESNLDDAYQFEAHSYDTIHDPRNGSTDTTTNPITGKGTPYFA